MLRFIRRWPAYALNGLSVSVGVGLVQAISGVLGGSGLAQAASIGAVLASLPHLTGRALPTWRRCLVGGILACLAALAVTLLAEHPWLRGGLVAGIAFVALLGMAWGTRAASLVFSVIIGVIFSLARSSSQGAFASTWASALGVVLYSSWAFVNAKLLEPRYRVLAVFDVIEAAAALLRARAVVVAHQHVQPEEDAAARFGQLKEEVRLAQALQNARDLVFPAAAQPGGAREVAILTRVAELREILLTSRLDLELLGHDHAARFVRARLALGLRRLCDALAELRALRTEPAAGWASVEPSSIELPDLLEAATLIDEADVRARLLPVIATRLRYLSEEVTAIRGLLRGDAAVAPLDAQELASFVADDDTWPLRTVVEHLSLRSPVLRHAVRSALALTTVYYLAYALPWATRPYWMLLSVAVVLRGTLDDTLSRRNARVLGTAFGCVLVTLMVPLVPDVWLKLAFIAAAGTAHAFVNVRYLLTAVSATVMALLQAHFAAPGLAPLVLERLLDTILGALFAWAFSYVLPSWERRSLPAAIERALGALRDYNDCALTLDAAARPQQRLARQRAYDALATIAAALQRSAAEPKRVRPPVEALVATLDHAQRLMAHLSSLRSLLQRRAEILPTAEAARALGQARQAIAERLSVASPRAAFETAPPLEPPRAPIEREPLPWLLRRLEASVHDATQAGIFARLALNELSQPDRVVDRA